MKIVAVFKERIKKEKNKWGEERGGKNFFFLPKHVKLTNIRIKSNGTSVRPGAAVSPGLY